MTPRAIFRGKDGLKNAKNFMQALGDPQEDYKSVHIAATSGKGTVAMMVSAILSAHGFKVGTTLSPYVYDLRERCQINNQLISKKHFVRLVNNTLPIIAKYQNNNALPTYFVAILGMAFRHFSDERVDYAVVETGLGGLLDASNTIAREDKVALIGRIGKDHTEILGNTLAEISFHKAGIIQKHNPAIALEQNIQINSQVQKRATEKNAKLFFVKKDYGLKYLEGLALSSLNDQLWGKHEIENFSLALKVVKFLAKRDDWVLDKSKLINAIKLLRLPGRFEQISLGNKLYILDGAHNKQKIEALLDAVDEKFGIEKFGVITAMKMSKEIPDLSNASHVLTTNLPEELQDMNVVGYQAKHLANRFVNLKWIRATKNIEEAIELSMTMATRVWIITGSFYLLSSACETLKNKKSLNY
jgi:dihydrofolate synthase / folylpolyglutamate synthase